MLHQRQFFRHYYPELKFILINLNNVKKTFVYILQIIDIYKENVIFNLHEMMSKRECTVAVGPFGIVFFNPF